MNRETSLAKKLLQGFIKGVKWIIIQCLFLLPLFLVYVYYPNYKLLYFSYGMISSVLVYTLMFALLHSFKPERKTLKGYITPWSIVLALGLIRVYLVPLPMDHPLWRNLVRVSYLIGVAIAPIFGAMLQILFKKDLRRYYFRLINNLLFLSFMVWVSCTRPASPETTSSFRSSSAIYGVDVSHHNGKIYWETLVKQDKIQFVFVKATEGATIVDEKYYSNLFKAKDAGLKVGAYHFLTTSSTAQKQFENYKNVVNEADIDLIPVLDAEVFTAKQNMSAKEYVYHVRTWANLCKEHYGKAPILYCSIEHYQKYLKGSFDDCLFWAGDVYAKKSYVNTESWTIWQKTIKPCVGSSSRLDINVLASGKTLDDISLHPTRSGGIVGIDVSHHNGKINWKAVKSDRPDLAFVYVKCTEGATYVDPEFKANAKGAREQGFNVGAYHYFRMSSSAQDQFRNFKKNLDAIEFNLIPMVDVEKDDGKPRKELQDSLSVFLALIKDGYGVKPMLYGTNSSYNKYCAPEFNDYLMYIGRYGKDAPIVKGAGYYTIWQYSESGKIKGIPKPVDLCRFHPKSSLTDISMP